MTSNRCASVGFRVTRVLLCSLAGLMFFPINEFLYRQWLIQNYGWDGVRDISWSPVFLALSALVGGLCGLPRRTRLGMQSLIALAFTPVVFLCLHRVDMHEHFADSGDLAAEPVPASYKSAHEPEVLQALAFYGARRWLEGDWQHPAHYRYTFAYVHGLAARRLWTIQIDGSQFTLCDVGRVETKLTQADDNLYRWGLRWRSRTEVLAGTFGLWHTVTLHGGRWEVDITPEARRWFLAEEAKRWDGRVRLNSTWGPWMHFSPPPPGDTPNFP